MKFAYADPPYLGCAQYYARLHPRALAWNKLETHRALIERLSNEWPDGWALSCTTPNLHDLLPMCPRDVRIMAWVKPFCSFKPGVRVAYAWEPVLVRGGRRRSREQGTVRDWTSHNITLRKGLTGAKPPKVIDWVMDVLNVLPGDTLDDLFPGTGVVGLTANARLAA